MFTLSPRQTCSRAHLLVGHRCEFYCSRLLHHTSRSVYSSLFISFIPRCRHFSCQALVMVVSFTLGTIQASSVLMVCTSQDAHALIVSHGLSPSANIEG